MVDISGVGVVVVTAAGVVVVALVAHFPADVVVVSAVSDFKPISANDQSDFGLK